MAKVGFVGLGAMGSGIARSLLRAGHEVTAYNRSHAPGAALARDGATVVDAPAGVAHAAEVVFSMLADDRAVESVVLAPGGVREALPPGAAHVSLSTISVALSRRLAEAHREAGQLFVAAPVFGRPEAAAAGKLFVVAAGEPTALERVRPLLAAIGQRTFEVGDEPAAANLIKLGGNFLLACAIEALGESAALMQKGGVAPATFVEVMTNTIFGCRAYEGYGAAIAQQRYQPAGFRVPLGLKDVRLVLAAGEDSSTPLPLASLVRDQLLSAIGRGHAELDWSALALVAAENAGVRRNDPI